MDYKRLMDVSTNWLMPIEDVVNTDVVQRRLYKNLGHGSVRGASDHLLRILKEQGVHNFLQLLAVKKEPLEKLSHRKDMATILDSLDMSMPRVLKNDVHISNRDPNPNSVFIGQYADTAELIPLGNTADVYDQMEEFISKNIYKNQVDIKPLNLPNHAVVVQKSLKEMSEERLQKMRDRFVAEGNKKAAGKKNRTSARKKAPTGFDKLRIEYSKAAKNSKIMAFDHKFFMPVTDFVNSYMGDLSQENRRIFGEFCEERNLHTVLHLYAVGRRDRSDLEVPIQDALQEALESHAAKFPDFVWGAAQLHVEALGGRYRNKRGIIVFSGNKELNLNRFTHFLCKKFLMTANELPNYDTIPEFKAEHLTNDNFSEDPAQNPSPRNQSLM